MNPSIDGSSEADALRPIRKIRTTNERYDPGGGGINVARVIAELGGEALVLYLAGGATGSVLEELLTGTGAGHHRINIRDHTRISHVVFERSTRLEYRFVPEGPRIEQHEWQACLDLLKKFEFACLVASGSLPRGVPTDFYAKVSEIARRKKAMMILDTSGPALRHTLEGGGIKLVKPSFGEFEELVGRKLPVERDQHEAAMSFVKSGRAELVAVTLGHQGAFLAHSKGIIRMKALPVTACSAVGAGDSFVAAMTLGLVQGRAMEDAFMYGMAAGTAAVLAHGTALCNRHDVGEFYRQLRARSVP